MPEWLLAAGRSTRPHRSTTIRARTGHAAPGGFGYDLTGQTGWHGRIAYTDEDGSVRVALEYSLADRLLHSAMLEIEMPYLADGVRRFHGEDADGRPVALQLQAGPCEIEPGDRFTHFVALRAGGQVLAGCAREHGEDDRWSNYLMDYMPAIDACLAEFSGQPAHVSVAHTMRGGATGVRIVDESMQSWECVTREDGASVNSLRPLDSADAIFGEGDPIFVRGVFPDFGEGCYVYESVREADGTLIGALGYDACNAVPVTAVGDPGMG